MGSRGGGRWGSCEPRVSLRYHITHTGLASPLTCRSAATQLQPPPRSVCRWQEAASAELKTIRVDQRKCRVGWRAGQILISARWPHTSLRMSHPAELSGHAVWIRFLQARFAKLAGAFAGSARLTARNSREVRKGGGDGGETWLPRCQGEPAGSPGPQDDGTRERL